MTLVASLISRIATTCSIEAETLCLDTQIDDLGLDSFSLLNILTSIEAEVGIELRDEDIMALLEGKSIGDYVGVLTSVLNRDREHLAKIITA
jgi:acyl carrier protein